MIRRNTISVKVKYFYFSNGSCSSFAEFNLWDSIVLLFSFVNTQCHEFNFFSRNLSYAICFTVIFCCCLCDCRIPKTAYDKHDKLEEGSDCSDTEPTAAVRRTPQVLQGEKTLGNSPAPQKSQKRTTDHEIGRANKAFDHDGEINAQHTENWKGTPRVTFSRQP